MICRHCGRRMDDGAGSCAGCGAERDADGPPDHEHDPRIGATLEEKYRIDARIGAGGAGTVYRATRLAIGDSVAVKILHAERLKEPEAEERFRREAQAAARLRHGNVVTIHDFGVSDDGTLFLVMELAEGESLRHLIEREGRLQPPVAVEILAQVCSALEEAHAQGVVHRDIKPDNIFVTRGPTGLRVKVLDFGIARIGYLAPEGDLTQAGRVLGTPHYMSPEQCLGEELDGRSDLYSLGVVLYEMLSGSVPFDASTPMAIVIQQVNETPTPLHERNPDISPAAEAVVDAVLQKRRDDRPASATALAMKLNHAVTEVAGSSLPAYGGAARTTGGLAPTVQMSAPSGADGGIPRAAGTGRSAGVTSTAGGGRRRRRRAGFWTGAVAASVVAAVIVVGGEWLEWHTEEVEPAPAGAGASPVEPGGSSTAPETGGPAEAAVDLESEEPAPPARAQAGAVPPAASAAASATSSPSAGSPAPRPVSEGSLVIRARPGSAVQLDGADVGTTDGSGVLDLAGIRAGRHVLVARKEGYADAVATVSVVPGQSEMVELSLVELPGALTVTANTPDVTVRIEGVGDYGLPVTGLEVPAGLRRVAASKPGYLPVEDAVDVRRGEAATLALVLERVPVETALGEARSHFNLRSYREAALGARAVLAEYGGSGEAYLLLGRAVHELGRFDDAANFLGRAIELGQEVELPARHRHGGLGLRVGFCDGVISLSGTEVAFRSAVGSDHSFVVAPDRIRAVNVGEDRIDMRIAVVDGGRERERNFDFVHTNTVRGATDNSRLLTELSCRNCDGSLMVLGTLLQKARGL